jgi:uncharacterized Zn-binding protein involved in type VI secretion
MAASATNTIFQRGSEMKYSILMSPACKAAILTITAICIMGQGSVASAAEVLNRAVTEKNVRAIPLAQNIQLTLTYPAGKSPKVFTKGWVFGAGCLVNPGTRDQVDNSGNVRWKGTGTFTPDRGPLSRPAFNGPGTNSITLYVEKDGKIVCEKTFTVEAVDPKGYARVGGIARCPVYAMGCPACPHDVSGPILSGSPNVFIDGLPAARVGDTGNHSGGCGLLFYEIKAGDPSVLIDGKPAARVGDPTHHGGGMGTIISATGK